MIKENGKVTMAWRTLYVTGRRRFESELLEALNRSGEHFLTGSFDTTGTYLFWVTDDFSIATLKCVIGSRQIFKYRMRFFDEVESFLSFKDIHKKMHRFTPEQEQMFRDLDP